jgi:surface polysaccharide O-acyltransferase-like enzyme
MKRNSGLDLVRFIAILFIPSVHFFLNNGFYNTNVKGIEMFFMIIFRWLFYLAVPLFLLLTGYLNKNKKLNKDYYKNIYKVLISYIFISIICILVRKIYLHEKIRILNMILSIFNFSACGYAWYVEMYIGLFLLIPFLNILYDSLKTKKNKQYLLLTIISLCSISPLINYIKIDNIYIDIVPNWWVNLYPIMYYYIGCYINEFKIEINKKKGLIVFIIILLLETILSYIYNYNNHFSWDFIGGYNSLQTVINAMILFLLLYKVDLKNQKINKIITNVSILSFDIYLFSYIADKIIYNNLDQYLSTPQEYFKYMLLIIMIVFILSYILSYIKKIIFDTTKKIINK